MTASGTVVTESVTPPVQRVKESIEQCQQFGNQPYV